MPVIPDFHFNLILILVPTTRNPGLSLIPMGRKYKTFLGVPGSLFLHGWQWFFCSWAVPGGLGDIIVGIVLIAYDFECAKELSASLFFGV